LYLENDLEQPPRKEAQIDQTASSGSAASACSVSSSLEFETEWEIEARIREEYKGCLIGRFESEYHQPIFRSKYPTVKTVKENASSRDQVTNPDNAPLPNGQHLPSTPDEPHALKVSEKPRENRVNANQWNKVTRVARKLFGKKEKKSQQSQRQKGGEISGVERHGQLVQHGNVVSDEISLPNVKGHPRRADARFDQTPSSASDAPTCSISSFEVAVLEDERGKYALHPETGNRVNMEGMGQDTLKWRPLSTQEEYEYNQRTSDLVESSASDALQLNRPVKSEHR